MKKTILYFLLFLIAIAPAFGLGSVITIRNNYFYVEPDLLSQKYYIPTYTSFKVLDIAVNENNRTFFLVEKNVVRRKTSGIGFIYEKSETNKEKKVKLFRTIPTEKSNFQDTYDVSIDSLKPTGKTFSAKKIPFLVWYEVEYSLDFPEKIWATVSGTIYRPNKSIKWLAEKSEQLLKNRSIFRKKRESILAGIVEIGFTETEVILTLDEPVEKKSLDGSIEWNYGDKKIIFQNSKVFQIIFPEI